MSRTSGKLVPAGVTRADLSQIAFQAMLKGIPYIGESLNHFIFGPLEEARWRRLEQTLQGEVVCGIERQGDAKFILRFRTLCSG